MLALRYVSDTVEGDPVGRYAFFNIVFSGAKSFCLRMGTELVPETLYSNELTRLCARENYIALCRRESFKTYTICIVSI
jgi:hypothetical protein